MEIVQKRVMQILYRRHISVDRYEAMSFVNINFYLVLFKSIK